MSRLLLSALADYPSSRSVHGARRCDSGGRYHNVAAGLNLDYEGTSARASECRLRASIGTGDLSARRCAEHKKNFAVFGVAHGASEAARLSAAEWRTVRALLCTPSACASLGVQITSLQRWLQHERLPNSSAEYLECSDCIFAVLHHFNVCSLCQHTICATGTARAPMARC